ncbi:histone-lysine N-methyltransferase SETMAR [Trichonephila clavipes]|nr:histone-lysine N-methyltransferase SETMAR [Trichonephila clavipes]
MEISKEKVMYVLQFFFDKGKNASQTTKTVNGVYGLNAAKTSYIQFWFCRFLSGMPVVKKNVDKNTEMIVVNRNVSSRSIIQRLKIDH